MTPRVCCLALVCALAVPGVAQHKRAAAAPAPADVAPAPAAPSPTDKVKVDKITYDGTGATEYAQADFAAATGLAPGMIMRGEIQKGADTLSASGQFADVGYTMDGSTLIYKITAAPKTLPVHFENFAWWNDIDLLRELHAKCPLFLGTLAGKGELETQVHAILTAMATEKAGSPVKVDSTLLSKPGEGPYAIAYSIQSPPILIGRVELAHETLDMSSQVAQVERSLEGHPYSHSASREYLLSRLGEAYAAHGYIDFTIKQFEAADPRKSGDGFDITITGNLDAGPQYHVSAIYWNDTPQMSKAAFDSADSLKTGDIAALIPLQTTLHNIERTYQLQGFVNAKATAKPTLDREHATVSYLITVEPGTAFHTSE